MSGILATVLARVIIDRIFSQPPIITIQGENGLSFQIIGKKAERLWMRENEKKANRAYNEGSDALVQRKYVLATSKFLDAIYFMPNFADSYVSLSYCYIEQGKYAEGLKAAREAIRIKPNSAPAHNSLGSVFYRQNRFREAEKEHRVAIRLKPGNPRYISNLGEALIHLKEYHEAEKYIREAIQLEPNFGSYYLTLGNIYFAQGNYNEAERQYNETIKLNPDYPWGYYNLACTNARLGFRDKAFEYFKTSLNKGLNDWELIDNDKDLDSLRVDQRFNDLVRAGKQLWEEMQKIK